MAGDRQYYVGGEFRRDMFSFVRDLKETGAAAAVLEYEEALGSARGTAAPPPACSAETADLEAVPLLAPGVALLEVDVDYTALVASLREKRPVSEVPRRRVVLADRQKTDFSAEVIEVPALAAALMKLCDGTRTVRNISAAFPRLDDELEGLPPRAACLFALNELGRQGLIVFAAGPGAATPA